MHTRCLCSTAPGVAMYDDVAKVFSRADEITAMGLSVPQVTRIFMGLRAPGLSGQRKRLYDGLCMP